MTYVRPLLAFILLAAPAMAQSAHRFTVEAGDTARHDAPAIATIPAGDISAGTWQLKSADAEKPVLAQVEKSGDSVLVRWIEPDLAAGKSRTYELAPYAGDPTSFTFKDGDGFRDLRFGKQGVWRHMLKYDPADRENTYKPYHHIFAFEGEGFITKGPGGKYPHHRGIFFGFKAFDADKKLLGDYWHCPAETQQHVKYLPDREFTGPVAARAACVTDWVNKDGKAVVRDTRDLTAWHVSPTKLVIDCEVTTETLTGAPITLGGDAHHAGLHFRAAQSIADSKDPQGKAGSAIFTRPPTAKLIKDDVWSGCPWVHEAFDIDGHHYQVTHMDGPDNPKPTTYSTRPYGRFGAFFTADTTPEKPLKVLYRLVISEGDTPTPEQLEQGYASFVHPLTTSQAAGK